MAIRWGIIGVGDVCEVKSGPGFQKARDSELVAVMRRDGAKAADYAKRHGVPRWSDDADSIIHGDDVDAVYVATPVGSHMDYALRVLAAGKPVYVEKPMARSHVECMRMIDAARQAGQKLFVAYYRRGLPRFVKTKQLVEDGALGRITAVSYRLSQPRFRSDRQGPLPWRLQAAQSGGGDVMDLGCHLLDVLDFVLGPIDHASGAAANLASPAQQVEDCVAMHMRFASGALGTASWNFASDAREDILEITGTDGRVSLSCFGNEPVAFSRGGKSEPFDLPNPPHVQQPLIQSIVDDLLGRGSCPSTGESAARTSRVLDDVLEGYYGTRADAFWDRPETWPGRAGR